MSKTTPLKAIRLKCLDCCCDSWKEVELCPSDGKQAEPKCPLWDYRLGKNPFSHRKGNPEALLKYREKKIKAC